MALGATIYKATLEISDLDRGWYGTRHLTIACHPSETESRMMVRVLAFALYASDKLEFGRGISADDDADLWETNGAGDIGRWIDVGTPDNKSLRRAAGKSDDVVVLAYDDAKVEPWWASNKGISGRSTSSRSSVSRTKNAKRWRGCVTATCTWPPRFRTARCGWRTMRRTWNCTSGA